ncbi:MAG: MMPL family transporter [Planctomycetaceae bacterium]
MFQKLGNLVSRTWPAVLAAWILVLAVLAGIAPTWDEVIRDGEFRFLPDDVPSRQAEELFRRAYSNDLLGSSVVIVVRRESRDEGLLEDDYAFVENVLKPRLERITGYKADTEEDAEGEPAPDAATAATADPPAPGDATKETGKADVNFVPPLVDASLVSNIRTFRDNAFGQLLVSDDNQATLVIIELTTEFMELRNRQLIEAIEAELVNLRTERVPSEAGKESDSGALVLPAGLDLAVSGLATVGRDMRVAARESGKATERMTIVLVIILLLAIYRAPILALIPLVTVFVAVKIAIFTLSILARAGIVELFNGIEVYVTVVLYGAGVDFCMFLMARYKEELDSGKPFDEAIASSVGNVGEAITASAGTVMFGIGMMVFAQFGKFQQAGIAMSMSLMFTLAAALTFAPALMALTGRWAFWPRLQTERVSGGQGWISPTSVVARIMEKEWFAGLWHKVGELILARPGTIFAASMLLMTPFAVISILYMDHLSYGLLSELPSTKPSVVGAKAIQKHFPAGITGPVTVLIENREKDFSEAENWQMVNEVSDALYEDREHLDIADIRSVGNPLGLSERVQSQYAGITARRLAVKRGMSHYVSDRGDDAGHVARMDVIFNDDPLSRDSIERFDTLQVAVKEKLPDGLKQGTTLHFLGSTASIRDLKTITNNDQTLIDILVPGVVFLILVVLLRKIATPAYLIFTVFFSFLVTLGIAFALFYLLDRHGFGGLDWKVRMFLFTILIAVGQDYNIFLITRIEEEQKEHGPIRGIIEALLKTGSIISSCGIIMAGTFSALLWGSLMGMKQLGFALAFGVLLDTFVVRPILVPCYLILLHRGRFGGFGKFLGAHKEAMPEKALTADSARDRADS